MIQNDLGRGTALTLVIGAGAFLLAHVAFGRLHALGALLPAAMAAELLTAWLIHLKSDGWFGGPAHKPEARDGSPYAHVGEEVLPRGGSREPAWTAQDVMRALLWSAGELCLLSIALYHLAGIGAGVFR